jgi:hypothetical protein
MNNVVKKHAVRGNSKGLIKNDFQEAASFRSSSLSLIQNYRNEAN